MILMMQVLCDVILCHGANSDRLFEGTMIFWNVKNYTASNTPSDPRRLKSSDYFIFFLHNILCCPLWLTRQFVISKNVRNNL